MKARCKNCVYLNWDFITGEQVKYDDYDRCGLHGNAPVNPDGQQDNLDGNGGCGYQAKQYQMTLFDLWGDF